MALGRKAPACAKGADEGLAWERVHLLSRRRSSIRRRGRVAHSGAVSVMHGNTKTGRRRRCFRCRLRQRPPGLGRVPAGFCGGFSTLRRITTCVLSSPSPTRTPTRPRVDVVRSPASGPAGDASTPARDHRARGARRRTKASSRSGRATRNSEGPSSSIKADIQRIPQRRQPSTFSRARGWTTSWLKGLRTSSPRSPYWRSSGA